MLISLKQLINKYNMNINGILHVGAHECEELEIYNTCGITSENIIWFEGNPKKADIMRIFGVKNIYNILVSDEEEEVDFIITNNGESSSILELDEHLKEHPHVYEVNRLKLKTQRIDNALQSNNIKIPFNFVNLDIQGAE
jgi:hypothetical protein